MDECQLKNTFDDAFKRLFSAQPIVKLIAG